MSLYAQYLKEREGIDTLETDKGFATYILRSNDCYIIDIYVVPEARKADVASSLADKIVDIARAAGKQILTGSVDVRLPSAPTSEKVLLSYGFKPGKLEYPMMYFFKEIA